MPSIRKSNASSRKAQKKAQKAQDVRAEILDEIEERCREATERAWGRYPSEGPLSEADFLTAEEALAQEEQLLGKRGVPLDDDLPDFLQVAAKAGPVKLPPKEKEKETLPAIINTEAANDHVGKPPVTRTVTLMRDHLLDIPDLFIAVHVLPDPDEPRDEAMYAKMFARSGCNKAKNLETADLVIFSGGSDVDPRLYGEERHEMTYWDKDRDDRDMEAYLRCRELGIPMMGVCRGAQFLHVMNGGKLYQNIDNHYGSHKMYCMKQKLMIDHVSSSHHQAVRYQKGMEIMATCNVSNERWLNNKDKEEGPKPDIEAFFYRDTGCFGVQGHPEYANYNKFTMWTLEMINDLFLTNPDYEWETSPEGGRLRKKKDPTIQMYIENTYNPATEA